MMAPEHRESMQKGHAASTGCLQGKSFFHGPHCPRSFSGQILELKLANGDTKQPNPDTNRTGESINTDKLEFSSECCGRPAHHENFYIWSTLPPNFLKEIHNQSHHFDGCLYPGNRGQYFPTHWFPQPPFHTIPHGYPPEYGFQDFQYFVVIDFEATCDKENKPHPQEIIEFPSVLVNSRTGQLEDCFQIYVRPTHNQMLSDFCKELTGIQQSQVDEGVLLSEALFMHDKWLEEKGIKHGNFAVVTWSNWDCKVMLESECRFKRIRKPPYFNRWINLKVPFCEAFSGVRCNLKDAVELAGLTWQGRAHCGLDDAKNTARLLAHLMHRGLKLSITSSILWQSAGDHVHYVHQNQQNIRPNPYGLTYQVQAHQKYKNPSPSSLFTTLSPFQPQVFVCYCGAASVKRVVRKPGPQHGSFFFGCGNWTVNRGASCSFFKWVSSDYESPTETGT